MPVGMQLIGRRWQGVSVLNAARAVEHHHPWYDRYSREFGAA